MFTLPLLPHTYPLSRVPFSNTFSTPPSSKHRIALLMCSCPWMDGARDRASTSNTSCKSREQLHISFLLIYTHFNQTPVTLYPTPLSPPSPTSHSLICSPSHSPSPPSYSPPYNSFPHSFPSPSPPSTLPLTKSLLRPNLLIFFTS